jgi:hypothetical protein
MRTRPVIAGIALLLAACGGSVGETDGVKTVTHALPTAADAVVFRVDTRGGFTSADYQLSIVPQLTAFGDGRVVVTGPTTEQYPPHALPNLLTGRFSQDEMLRLSERAFSLGLFQPRTYGHPGISDAPTTTVTIGVGGRHEQSAYALDFDSGDTPGLTEAQRDARHRLSTFVQEITDSASRVATEPYVPTAVAVFVRPATATADGSGVTPGQADWPLGDLATIGAPMANLGDYRCAVLTGDDARTALAAAADATSITRWRSNGFDYAITWRPLLADEHTCPNGP